MSTLRLSEVVMPRMGGEELVKRIKTLYPEIKVLFISGYTDTAVNQHVLFGPKSALLQKPFSPTVLSKKAREVLDK